MLTIIDRYILRQVAKPLATALAIGLLMLLAERMVHLLDSTLGKRDSFGVVFELLAYLVPHYLGTAIPAALFLGLLFGFSKLSKDSEIDAIMATGTGISRLVRPIIFLSFAFCALSVFIVGWLQPETRYAYRSVLFDVRNVEIFYLAEEGVFMQVGSRTFILDKLDRSTNRFEHVFLFDYKDGGKPETLTASNGILVPVEGQPRPVLQLNNGHRLRLDSWPSFNAEDKIPKSTISEFHTTDTPLGKISEKLFRPRGEDERELTLPELYAKQGNPPAGATPDMMRAELHLRFVHILTLLMLPLLAVPFAIVRQRGQRGYRFGIALVLVVAFHEIIEQGAVATRSSGLSPWLTMWFPFSLITALAIWRFYLICFTLKPDWFGNMLDSIDIWAADFWRPIARRLGMAAHP